MGVTQALYGQIGGRYTSTRHPDPRIAAAIVDALGDPDSVINVGAGAGAYEPVGRGVVAVEPSWLRTKPVATSHFGAARSPPERSPR